MFQSFIVVKAAIMTEITMTPAVFILNSTILGIMHLTKNIFLVKTCLFIT